VIVVAPRFLASLTASPERGSRQHVLDPATWANTQVMLGAISAGPWRNVFTGVTHDLPEGTVAVSDLLVDFPVAVLTRG
jgi:maltooligosyltrehalose synthase